jgi:Na+-driven multidrug efflux pump
MHFKIVLHYFLCAFGFCHRGCALGMEFWIFEVTTVIVAHMGSVVVDTYQVLITISR